MQLHGAAKPCPAKVRVLEGRGDLPAVPSHLCRQRMQKIHTELKSLNSKGTNNPINKWRNELIDLKKKIQVAINTWKHGHRMNANQSHYSMQSEWPASREQSAATCHSQEASHICDFPVTQRRVTSLLPSLLQHAFLHTLAHTSISGFIPYSSSKASLPAAWLLVLWESDLHHSFNGIAAFPPLRRSARLCLHTPAGMKTHRIWK